MASLPAPPADRNHRAVPALRTTLALGALGPLLATLGSLLGAQQPVDWTRSSPAVSPPARFLHRAAHDSLRERVVVFGGQDLQGAQFGDTWSWDGTLWHLATPPVSPPARHGHGMCFDERRGRVVLFGGTGSAASGGTLLADTWTWDGATWHPLATAGAPAPRSNFGICHDLQRGVNVLFGGAGVQQRLADTWELDGATWVQRSPAASPSPRTSHAMAHDRQRGVSVVFGGVAASNLDDTWTWDGTNWTLRTSAQRPVARRNSVLAEDPVRGRLVLFGGYAQLGVTYGDQWTWDGTQWAPLQTASSPTARENSALAWDDRRQQLVLFGGFAANAPLAETWLLGSPTAGALATPYGRGCGTPELRLVATQPPRLGATLQLEVRNVARGFALAAFGTSAVQAGSLALPLDLTPLGTPGCLLHHDVSLAWTTQMLPLGTTWQLALAVPNQPALLGVQLFAQGWTTTGDPAALVAATSNGLRLLLGR